MRRSCIFLVLLVASGCGSALRGKPRKAGLGPQGQIPRRIDDSNYGRHRQLYDALALDASARKPLRRMLLRHLVGKANRAAKAGRVKQAYRHFEQAATLYDATVIYGGVKPDPALVELARRIVAIFSPRGDEAQVVVGLCVQISATPAAKTLRGEVRQILDWVDRTVQLTYGDQFKGARVVRLMETVAKVWPSPYVLDVLGKEYIERTMALARATAPGRALAERLGRETFHGLLQIGFKIASLYLRVDRLDLALQRLREVSLDDPADQALRRLLEQVLAPSANVEDVIRLAEYVEERERPIALRICRLASRRFPEEARAYACVGRLAAEENKVHLAIYNYERAVALAPDDRAYAIALAQQYQRRLFQLVGQEQLKEARKHLQTIERFYGATGQRFKEPLDPPLSRVYYAMGHGLYNAGHIELATATFRKSITAQASPQAMVQLALIRLKVGDHAGALAQLARAEKLPMRTAQERIYWQGRIEGLRGQALDLAGQRNASREAHRRAVQTWKLWLRLGLRREPRVEGHLHRARSLYALGELGPALDDLDRAIDIKPARKETYADVIALLTTHGHLPEALDAYHRALGREEVSEYLKAYCSFWIIGLARRAGKEPDPLATNYLRRLTEEHWYGKLARLVRGEITYEKLLAETTKVGERAELHFYWADRLVAEGKLKQARALWEKVLETKMLAFFEYDMASHNLRHGPATVKEQPVDRQRVNKSQAQLARDPD